MYLVGLNGGIGSGKSTVAELFAKQGIHIIDSDTIAREVVASGSPALKEIINYFGHEIISTDGQLDRAKLRQIVFNNTKKRVWLENLLHPLICDACLEQAAQAQSPYCLILLPLLVDSPLRRALDFLIVIDVAKEHQIKRASHRDNCETALIKKIIDAQQSHEYRLSQADALIDNNGDLAHLNEQVIKLHQQILASINKH